MAINKVIFGGNTLLDLTNDTVTADDVVSGKTVHLRDGTRVTGTLSTGYIVEDSVLYLTTILDSVDEIHFSNTYKDSDGVPLLDHSGNEIDGDGIIVKGGQYA